MNKPSERLKNEISKTEISNKPSSAWYIVAILLFIIGPITGISIIAHSFYKAFTSGFHFEAPGITTLTINKPGNYVLWGASKEEITPQMTKNVQVMVRALPSDQLIEVETIKSSYRKINDQERLSFAKVNFEQAGIYQIRVSGMLPEQSLLLRHSIFSSVFWPVFKGVILFLIGIVGGIIIALVTFIRRTNYETATQREVVITQTPSAPIRIEKTEEHGRIWATISHLAAFVGFIIPFGNIIAPLIVWLLLRKDYAFVDEQGKESLNFQISITIYSFIAFVLFLIVIGIFIAPLIAIFMFIAVIVASIETARGKHFKYPLSLKFIK